MTPRIAQYAITTYTVRDFIRTPPEIAASMKRIREIGYKAVQISAMGPIEEAELKRILDGEGLVCCATHEPPEGLLDRPEAVVERLQALGCTMTAYPFPANAPLATLDDVKQLAARLDNAGRVLHEAGCVLTYHNHHMEFRRIEGRPILEILYDETDPKHLQGEIDTYWTQYGGGDPVAWCERLRGRLPLLHLKDYKINDENQPTFAEVGQGNLDWPRILKAAEDSGCLWYIVEQDVCPGDPFDSLALSFRHIQERLACI